MGFYAASCRPSYSTAGYNIVPDSQTQIDRLKFSTKIGCATDVYLLGYVGYNEDLLRDTYRNFNGADLRITNRSIDSLTVTTYAKYYREDDHDALDAAELLAIIRSRSRSFYQETSLGGRPQIDRQTPAFGVNSRWRPFEDQCGIRGGLAFVAGTNTATCCGKTPAIRLLPAGPAHSSMRPASSRSPIRTRTRSPWASRRSGPPSSTRTSATSSSRPNTRCTALLPMSGTSIGDALNSTLPTQENRVELGCTWTPTDCLMVNATLYVENAMSNAPYVNWQSNSLPFTLSAWWAPTQDWSFSIGAAEMDSWINQDVSLGTARYSTFPPPG